MYHKNWLNLFHKQENVTETAEVNPTPQPEVTESQETNNDSEIPPSGDAVAEESPSQPVDEPPAEGEGGEAQSAEAGGDKPNQLQEGGDGEKPDLEGGVHQPQEAQKDMGVGPLDELFNPLSPNSDQHQISPCNINAYSIPEVMRIKDMITQGYFSWYFLTSPQYVYKKSMGTK